MKGIIDKSKLERIGRYINRQLVVHRNVENDTKWTTEESMIVELYDNYIELISEIDNLQQENQQLKEDILFCLKSIKQEMEMSTDSRTKQEMLSCYQILSKWSDK